MNKEDTQERIKIMAAYVAGETIECKPFGESWRLVECPNWLFDQTEYRVKRKPIERWANMYPGGGLSLHEDKSEANHNAMPNRVDCVLLREVAA